MYLLKTKTQVYFQPTFISHGPDSGLVASFSHFLDPKRTLSAAAVEAAENQ